LISFAFLMMSAIGADTSPNWPGFLGGGDVRLTAESLPLTWSPTENIAWQAALPGHGQSSPVIWEGKVFVTAVEGPMKDTYHVLAFDLEDGRALWKHSLESSDKVKESYFVSRAAPTPVTDGRAIYAVFESGDVVALTLDGKQRWRRKLSNEYGKFQNEFGLGASPVQTDDAVIWLADHDGPSYLIALSKLDGRTLWKTDRTPRRSWSSPALVRVAGQLQVVCSSAGSVDGYDPKTGRLLWSFDELAGNTAATPLGFADGQFLVGASPGNEGGARVEGAKRSNLAMAIELAEGKPAPKILWRTEEVTPTFASPKVYAGHAYWINRVGVVYCFDAATGEQRYAERVKQSCWATPIGAGDRLYLFGKDGVTTVLRAGPRFEVLAENQLWDPASVKPDPAKVAAEDTEERRRAAAMFSGRVQYGVAAAANSLVIRTGDVLYCVRHPVLGANP
jgi:outer membrane protein assembly factor BamB